MAIMVKQVQAQSLGNPGVECSSRYAIGNLHPRDTNNTKAAEIPRPDTHEVQRVQLEAKERHFCVLVVGPSGSGKSTFIASVSGVSKSVSKAMIGHGLDPGTTSCSTHEFIEPSSGIRITLVDTPGFNDQSRNDMDILSQIKDILSPQTLPPISAVIFTHAITENRVTGSSRLNLGIAKALCGDTFYPRLALLTTMWNKAPDDEAGEIFSTREAQILSSSNLWAGLKDQGCLHARFDGSTTSGMSFVRELLDLGQLHTVDLAFQQELLQETRLEQTKAGAIIVAEQKKRQRQAEEELEEIKKEEMQGLQAERERLRASSQRDKGLNQQSPELAANVVTQAPGMEDAMAYGETFNLVEREPEGGSVRERHQPRFPWKLPVSRWKLQIW